MRKTKNKKSTNTFIRIIKKHALLAIIVVLLLLIVALILIIINLNVEIAHLLDNQYREVIVEEEREKAYMEEERLDPNIAEGVVEVQQEGLVGKVQIKYRIIYKGEIEISKEEIEETVVVEPVNKIIVKGTKIASVYGGSASSGSNNANSPTDSSIAQSQPTNTATSYSLNDAIKDCMASVRSKYGTAFIKKSGSTDLPDAILIPNNTYKVSGKRKLDPYNSRNTVCYVRDGSILYVGDSPIPKDIAYINGIEE